MVAERAAGVTIVRVAGAEGRRLVARLVARCSAASLGARLFLPESRVGGREVVTLLLGPADGWAYLALDDGRPVGLLNLASDGSGGGSGDGLGDGLGDGSGGGLGDGSGGGSGAVEAGVLVADRWQRRGVGRALLRHAVLHGPGPGTVVRVAVQADNAAALGMLRALGLPRRLVAMAPGEYHFELLAESADVRRRVAG